MQDVNKWEELDNYILNKYIKEEATALRDVVRPSSNPNSIGKLKKMPRGSIRPLEMEHQRKNMNLAPKSLDNEYSSKETFSEMLLRLIDEKNLNLEEVAKALNIDSLLKETNKDYKVPKDKTILLCFLLNLKIDIALDLLSKMGYGLSFHKRKDVIVRYFIEKEAFDISLLNQALIDHNLSIIE